MNQPKTYDIILAGVGGQGVLSLATVIAAAAQRSGLFVRQSEVHGMAQRGGSVLAHLRISSAPVVSDLIPKGRADMILAMEPLEALRYTDYLRPEGAVISSAEAFINITNYPDVETFLAPLRTLKNTRLLAASALAKTAGSLKSANLVLVGAAARFLPLTEDSLLQSISDIFGKKGQDVVDLNRRAFALGRDA